MTNWLRRFLGNFIGNYARDYATGTVLGNVERIAFAWFLRMIGGTLAGIALIGLLLVYLSFQDQPAVILFCSVLWLIPFAGVFVLLIALRNRVYNVVRGLVGRVSGENPRPR
jgi:uncharacterized membrane protein